MKKHDRNMNNNVVDINVYVMMLNNHKIIS